jgi:hypothetical protein
MVALNSAGVGSFVATPGAEMGGAAGYTVPKGGTSAIKPGARTALARFLSQASMMRLV